MRAKATAKAVVKMLADRLGYSIQKKQSHSGLIDTRSAYQVALITLLSCRETIRIVQVGANDGVVNDPAYDFIMSHRDRTHVLLIEPQECVIPHLKRNYSQHPSCVIFNGAIGAGEKITLYSVDESVWQDLVVPYAENWPDYRAPTGVTSTQRGHVRQWIQEHLSKPHAIDESIKETIVNSKQLIDILEEKNFTKHVDVLQVDTEGSDDEVLYNCAIDMINPIIIYFESRNLDSARQAKLSEFLEFNGYSLFVGRDDTIAISHVHRAASA